LCPQEIVSEPQNNVFCPPENISEPQNNVFCPPENVFCRQKNVSEWQLKVSEPQQKLSR
jgi:hypothetical protein